MTINLTQIILAVATLLFALLMRYVIPALRENLSANGMELLRIGVKTAVYAAEQLYNSDQGKEKKAWVLEKLKEQGYIIDTEVVEPEIDTMIEAFVRELHIEQAKIQPNG